MTTNLYIQWCLIFPTRVKQWNLGTAFQVVEQTSKLKDNLFVYTLFPTRCSLMGFDLNRHWLEPSPWAHPTLYATKNVLVEMDENEASQTRCSYTYSMCNTSLLTDLMKV